MSDAREIADALISAERERTPVVPFTHARPFLDAKTAYQAQALFVGHRLQAGESLIGTKLGLTSKVKRDALGIHEPVYGRLTSEMVIPFGEPVHVDELIHPRAEPELAFLLGRRVEAATTVAGVLAATEAVFPAIEIVDSRYSERFALPDSVADNAGAARVVFGAQARRPGELEDLRVLGCLFRSRDWSDTAAGGAAMGHPAAALVWLANTLAAQGECLEAGTIVLSGGLTASVPILAHGAVMAEFDGLGSVEIRCR